MLSPATVSCLCICREVSGYYESLLLGDGNELNIVQGLVLQIAVLKSSRGQLPCCAQRTALLLPQSEFMKLTADKTICSEAV